MCSVRYHETLLLRYLISILYIQFINQSHLFLFISVDLFMALLDESFIVYIHLNEFSLSTKIAQFIPKATLNTLDKKFIERSIK